MLRVMKRERNRRRQGRRGFTLVEVLIASAIATVVMAAVVFVQYTSGRTIKEVYGQTRTRSSRKMALDQIRYRLTMAEIGSVSITDKTTEGRSERALSVTCPCGPWGQPPSSPMHRSVAPAACRER